MQDGSRDLFITATTILRWLRLSLEDAKAEFAGAWGAWLKAAGLSEAEPAAAQGTQ
jgi:hypothetical protein